MLLEGKRGLVLNVTNKNSLGWGIADLANQHGATVGIGAQNERLMDGVLKLIEGRERFDPLMIDFAFEEQYATLKSQVAEKYGKIDFLVHAVGFAPRTALENRFIETTLEDFQIAMNASAYSLIRLCQEMEELFNEDASVITLSYLGSSRALPNYNIMGVCKAALESAVRYLARDLGDRGIRVNTVSPGPVNTVSGRGVKGITGMIQHVHEAAPLKRPYAQNEVAGTSLYLLSDLSKGVTGQLIYVDSGFNIIAM
ncbi:MAG: enoyl-ACP reductase [Fimbriimonadaceae bacterium]|nr:enoyl-ACP reductase [Fimbriimonadaceae bacterium]